MTTKRYLEQVERIGKLLDSKRSQVEKLKMSIGNMSVQTDKERVQSSGISNPTADQATELAELYRQIEFWQKRRNTIIEQIENVDDLKAYEVLLYRYIECRSAFDIADIMGLSEQSVWRHFVRARKIFEELYGETYL